MFGAIAKLKALLTDENLVYLEHLLRALVEREGSPVFDQLWGWFKGRYPDGDKAYRHAWWGLKRLHEVVKEQIAKRGIQ